MIVKISMRLFCFVLLALLAACANGAAETDSADVVAAVETLEASQDTRAKLGIVTWSVARLGEVAQVSGLGAQGSELAVFEVQLDAPEDAGGFQIISLVPTDGFQVRSRFGEIIYDEMAPAQSEVYDAMVSDMGLLARAESEIVPKAAVTCGPCGEAGTSTRCYGVVLWCFDHNYCTDGSRRRCANDYPCGVCVGLPF